MYREDWILLGQLVGVLILVLLIAFLALGMLEKASCDQLTALAPQYVHHWDWWNGCLVQGPNGYWFKPEEFPFLEIVR
jgi:hypothetical protein